MDSSDSAGKAVAQTTIIQGQGEPTIIQEDSISSEKVIGMVTEFVRLAEGFELEAYKDPLSPDGLPITIGYGATLDRNDKLFTMGTCISKEEADWLLNRDVRKAFAMMTSTPGWSDLGDGPKAALTDLAYNGGYFYKCGRCDSLDEAMKNKTYDDIGIILQKYDNKDALGLSRRRYAEWLIWQGASPKEAYAAAWQYRSVADIMTRLGNLKS